MVLGASPSIAATMCLETAFFDPRTRISPRSGPDGSTCQVSVTLITVRAKLSGPCQLDGVAGTGLAARSGSTPWGPREPLRWRRNRSWREPGPGYRDRGRVFRPGRKGTVMLDPTLAGPSGRGRRPRPLLRTMLGDVLRRTRREQGRTLADVAGAAGSRCRTCPRWSAGARRPPPRCWPPSATRWASSCPTCWPAWARPGPAPRPPRPVRARRAGPAR